MGNVTGLVKAVEGGSATKGESRDSSCLFTPKRGRQQRKDGYTRKIANMKGWP